MEAVPSESAPADNTSASETPGFVKCEDFKYESDDRFEEPNPGSSQSFESAFIKKEEVEGTDEDEEMFEIDPLLLQYNRQQMSVSDEDALSFTLQATQMTKRKSWDRDSMTRAIQAVKNKEMGYKMASKTFNVPRTTLKNYIHKNDRNMETSLGRKPVLAPEIEKDLVSYCSIVENTFYGLMRKDVRTMAFQLAIRNNVKHPFSKSKGQAGRKWLQLFFQRHPELTLRSQKITKKEGFVRENVDRFFSSLKTELEKVNFSPDRIFSVEEIGLTVVQREVLKVISVKGKQQVQRLSPAERSALVTAVTCMSPSGIHVPPLLVYPRKHMKPGLLAGAPTGSTGACHPLGWISAELFTQWFGHFISIIRPSIQDCVILVLDGYHSHARSVDLIELGQKHGVTFVCLPPHSADRMHPIDVAFLQPVKTYYAEEIQNWLDDHPDEPITQFQVAAILGKAYTRAATVKTAADGYKATGIFPFNSKVFTDADFFPNSQGGNSISEDLEDEQSDSSEDEEIVLVANSRTKKVTVEVEGDVIKKQPIKVQKNIIQSNTGHQYNTRLSGERENVSNGETVTGRKRKR